VNPFNRLRLYLANLIAPPEHLLPFPSRGGAGGEALSVTSLVDDSPGWTSLTSRLPAYFAGHDYDPSRIQELYQDALTAWRKNPIAFRIVGITTDYVVGDQFEISSSHRALSKFIKEFWKHPKNRMRLRLEAMCDELSRSGDLFVLLFRNDADGTSYLRFVTKDRMVRIETAAALCSVLDDCEWGRAESMVIEATDPIDDFGDVF